MSAQSEAGCLHESGWTPRDSVRRPVLRSIDTSSWSPFCLCDFSTPTFRLSWTSWLIQPLLALFSQVTQWARVDLRALILFRGQSPCLFPAIVSSAKPSCCPDNAELKNLRYLLPPPPDTCCVAVLCVCSLLSAALQPKPSFFSHLNRPAPGQVEETSEE